MYYINHAQWVHIWEIKRVTRGHAALEGECFISHMYRIWTWFMYFVSSQNLIIFSGAIATVISRVSIVTCYGNRGAKTCTTPHTRLFTTMPVALPLHNLFQQGFIPYEALVVPLICPRKVTQIYTCIIIYRGTYIYIYMYIIKTYCGTSYCVQTWKTNI